MAAAGLESRRCPRSRWSAIPATPLCWPGDPISARWADLLFYMPHNSCKLMDLSASMSAEGMDTLGIALMAPIGACRVLMRAASAIAVPFG